VVFADHPPWKSRRRFTGAGQWQYALGEKVDLLTTYAYSRSWYARLASAPTPAEQATIGELSKRRESRHRGRAQLLWDPAPLWLAAGLEVERNRSSRSGYNYRGVQVDGGGGWHKGRLNLMLHGSSAWRRYSDGGASGSVRHLIWGAVQASWNLSSWLEVFGGLQQEYGFRAGHQLFNPWSLLRGGFRITFPVVPSSPLRVPQRPVALLRPHATPEGWLFRYRAPEADSVHLIGTFCGWDAQTHGLKPGPEPDWWEIVIPLEPGVYEYAFLVNGREWVIPPHAPMYVDDGFGQRNGVLVIEASEGK
jgi:hypothetical protein